MKRALGAIALLILSSAHAISSADALGTHWSSIVDPLVASGVNKVGNFDVLNFQSQAKDILWRPIAGAPGLTASGSRQSAYYVCGQKTIHVSEQLPAAAHSSLAGLELHELLGALCFDDRNYAMSTALTVLARMSGGAQREKLIAAYSRAPYFHGIEVAGATSVSGGGDLDALFVKDQVLTQIMGNGQNQNAATTEFLTSYPAIDFEPVKNVSEVYVKYDYSISTKQETFQIMVPLQRWHASEASRNALIRETAGKAKTIFPAYVGMRTRTFVPDACRSEGKNLSATYPATNDINMLEIQQARAALTLGCNPIHDVDSIGITAPALAVRDEPKPSGFYYFVCEATIAGRLLERKNISTKAREGVLASWYESDALEISLGVGRDGRPIGTYFVFRDPQHHMPSVVPARGENPTVAETQLAGQTVHASCRRVN